MSGGIKVKQTTGLVVDQFERNVSPAGLKPLRFCGACGTAEEVTEKLVEVEASVPQALKREHTFQPLTARVNSCPSLSVRTFEFFRNL